MDQIMSRAFVLLSVAITTIALLVGGNALFGSTDLADFRNGIQQISSQMQENYRVRPGRYGTGTITYATLKAQGIVPGNWQDDSNSRIISPYNGTCTIGGRSSEYDIDCDNIPQADCVKLISAQFGGGSVVGARVASALAGLSSAAVLSIPASDTNATTACASENNAVRVTYR